MKTMTFKKAICVLQYFFNFISYIHEFCGKGFNKIVRENLILIRAKTKILRTPTRKTKNISD